MIRNRSITIKAYILLFVLVFQTLWGFACAIDHLNLQQQNHTHGQAAGMHQQHKHHHNSGQDCCQDESAHLVKADKLTSPELTLPLPPPLFLLHAPAPCTIAFLRIAPATAQAAYALCYHHPPVSDIRIAIQRFQI